MGSSKAILAVLISFSVPAVWAQTPAGDRGELKATMRVMGAGSDNPEQIFRKIPPPRSKKPGVNDDAPAKDLANPNGNGHDGGTAADPGIPSEPAPPFDPGPVADPVVPTEPVWPDSPDIGPDPRDRPGDFGHGGADDARGRGEDARHGKPPKENGPPGQQPRDRDPPGQRPRDRDPGDQPRDREPPGQRPPRERPPREPRGPKRPRE